MKSFNRIIVLIIAVIAVIFAAANSALSKWYVKNGREYAVEINRIAIQIERDGLDSVDLSDYRYVTHIEKSGGENFYKPDSSYAVREISGELYRFDYVSSNIDFGGIRLLLNIVILSISAVLIFTLIFIRQRILRPFNRLENIPLELSKGNLTAPIKESKGRFFGRFIWEIDLLREKMEEQKKSELELQKDRKMLMLSLSHDIKTPLSAIKLYSKALSKGLYPDKEKQQEIAESINLKADEIEDYLSQIISASREDFLSLDVKMGELYVSSLINEIAEYYNSKMALVKTEFVIGRCNDCLIKGDADRCIEVLQNIIENALKYGDGKRISLDVSEEEGCILISVSNTGCSLSCDDLPHIFESFHRGTNSENIPGSGLGLYICRQLMSKMDGEVFAEISGDIITVTAVFMKA